MTQIYLYWASTLLMSLLYLFSAGLYLIKPTWVRQTLRDFGYPAYLHSVLIAIKIVAPVLILSRASLFLSDLAYAGIVFHLALSVLAHAGVKKPAGAVPAVVGILLMATSFATQNSAREMPSPYAPVTAQTAS